jgi:phosphoglycerate dehydrogenase-like enzyme
MKPRVLLVEPLYDESGEILLRQHASVELLRKPAREVLVAAAAQAHGISARYPNRLDEEVIGAAKDLVVIAASGRGTDAIDIEAATRHGVAVVNNPGFGRVPVSEHALGLLLGLGRHLFAHDRMTRGGRGWQERLQPGNTIRDLEGGTLGIVGLGVIGTEMARKCIAAFNMQVIAYDPYVDEAAAAVLGVTLLPTLDEVLQRADYVSIHAELNDETRFMFDEAALRRMRPHACLINTARGKIVRQAALVRALEEGWIRAAALDVYEDEPVGEGNPLAKLDNVILSPHVGGLSETFLKGGAMGAATQILQALRGERPPHLVNPDAWERAKQRAARIAAD